MLPSALLPRSIAQQNPFARIGIATLAIVALLSPAKGETEIPETILFNRDVRPFMSNTCFKCHGADTKANEADLRLDIAELAYESKERKNGDRITPIVPGDPEASEAWLLINSEDPDEVMPPPDNLHQLTERDKAIFKRWIEQGAEYQSHWAYIPPIKAPLPKVADPSKARNAIDSFILAALDEHSTKPSPEASRSTLIRRLSLDLTGLPPTAGEVAAFLAHEAPGAYERLVDRLLDSPHYGERMAVPWLDLVRFADTVGYHGDQRQNNFPYRDYVIKAFNDNKPFDVFTIEQIAGDLLEKPSKEQLTATGFNRLNMMTREGGAQPQEYLTKYAADRVRTVSTAWLGSTMSCTECHDHKYDPFSTKDFYTMSAFFADVKQYGVYSDYRYTPEEDLVGWNNEFPFPPEIEVDSPYLSRRKADFERDYATLSRSLARKILEDPNQSDALDKWIQTTQAFLESNPSGWATSSVSKASSSASATSLSVKTDRSILFERLKDLDKSESVEIVLDPESSSLSTLRMEVLPDLANDGFVHRKDTYRFNADVSWAVRRSGQDKTEKIEIVEGFCSVPTENYSNGYLKASTRSSVKSSRLHSRQPNEFVYFTEKPVQLKRGDQLIVTLKSDSIGRVRFSHSPLGLRAAGKTLAPEQLAAFQAKRPNSAQALLRATEFLRSGTGKIAHRDKLLAIYQEIANCHNGSAFTAVTVSTDPLVTRVLGRGDWKDQTGEIVSPATPAFLSESDSAAQNARQSRLDLAQWIVSRDNPLTARTFVNRLWAQYFGTGLSGILDDLGNQGEWPSHPALLDWLAVEFMDRDWDVKAMARLIVTSATYRQSSRIRPELNELDPDNRLLARQSPRRLEAEFVRDNALFISGLMDTEIGGPSARPYQPDGYYAPLNFPLRSYQHDTDQRQYRRGVYTHWQRTFLHPMLANFDAPGREECIAQRSVSNTPQQALTLLNDPSFVEAARAAAQKLLQALPDENFETRLHRFFRQALARSPSERETESLSRFLAERLEHYRSNSEDAIAFTSIGISKAPKALNRSELAAWTALTRVVFNLNESIVRY